MGRPRKVESRVPGEEAALREARTGVGAPGDLQGRGVFRSVMLIALALNVF